MKISNYHKTSFYHFIYILLLLLLIGGIFAFLILDNIFKIGGWPVFILIIISFILVFFSYVKGEQIFEYDSEGEVFQFNNSNIIFLNSSIKDEFPKYKLISYEIISSFLTKRLYLKLSSKKGNSKILKYNITYMAKREITNLEDSLNRNIKE